MVPIKSVFFEVDYFSNDEIVCTLSAAMNINIALYRAISLSYEMQRPVRFEFNEIYVTVNSNSNPEDIKQKMKSVGRGERVGP